MTVLKAVRTHDVFEDSKPGSLPVCTRYSHVAIPVLPGLTGREHRTPVRWEVGCRLTRRAFVMALTKDDDVRSC